MQVLQSHMSITANAVVRTATRQLRVECQSHGSREVVARRSHRSRVAVVTAALLQA